EHGEHASLFRPWPAFARGASFGLRLACLMPRANGPLRCNRSPLAGGVWTHGPSHHQAGPRSDGGQGCCDGRSYGDKRVSSAPDLTEVNAPAVKVVGEPLAGTSSSSPARMSLSTASQSASPVTFVGRSTPRSSRCEAVDRMTSWVSVSLAIGILPCVGAASSPPPPQPHLGHAAGGAGFPR